MEFVVIPLLILWIIGIIIGLFRGALEPILSLFKSKVFLFIAAVLLLMFLGSQA